MNAVSGFLSRYFRWFVPVATLWQSVILLAIRLYWGWAFFLAGRGKLMNLSRTADFFQSLGIPLPYAQATLAATTECFGGLLLLIGLCSRLISIPLTILLVVAYLTADLDKVKVIFDDPDKFLTADEFLFLFAVVVVFTFGPGRFSLDWLIKRKVDAASLGKA